MTEVELVVIVIITGLIALFLSSMWEFFFDEMEDDDDRQP